ncbi:hypothetical protein IAT38_001992 [Cryptococcus sp. DSM 104549]
MSDSIPLPPRYIPDARPASVPPQDTELTRRPSSHYSQPIVPHPLSIGHPHLPVRVSDHRDGSAPPDLSPAAGAFTRRTSPSDDTSTQRAHQLAAEALLTMAPASNGGPSPDKRADKPSLGPGPSAPSSGRPTPMDVDPTEAEQRGVKRKAEDEPRLPLSLGLHGMDRDRERERAKERAYSNSPSERPQPGGAGHHPAAPSRLGQPSSASPAFQGSTPAGPNRYSVYGPTTRDPLGGTSPWSLGASRYSNLGMRRDHSPSVATTSKPALSPPRRASPVAADARERFYPSSSAAGSSAAPGASASSASAAAGGYGHYSMTMRELREHREQLREGKKWLETMMGKTEKMLHMVENKMALTGEMGPAPTHAAPPPSHAPHTSAGAGPGPGKTIDDWEFEERERQRQKEIQRLEQEREMDRLEKEKRERERERSSAYESELGRAREKSANRDRDHLLASRRVSAVSPISQPPVPGRAPSAGSVSRESQSSVTSNANGGVNGAANGGGSGSAAEREREREREKPASGKGGAWEGDPVMAGVPLPRREQQSGMGRAFGKGLWSFDVRG